MFVFMTMEMIIFFSLWIFSRKMTIGEISLLGFSGMHLNVTINESVLKILKTYKEVEKPTFWREFTKIKFQLSTQKELSKFHEEYKGQHLIDY